MRQAATAFAFALILALPVAAADHPGSNKGLLGLLPTDRLLAGPEEAVLETLVHRLPTVDARMARWESTFPDLVDRMTIGQTSSGHPLLSVRVTDELVPFETPYLSTNQKLRVYLDGGHHGNEYLGVELVLYYLEDLLTKAAAGDEATLTFLRSVEVYATPIINVDGNFADTRKNSRLVDPNRNYDFHWGEEGAGTTPVDFTYHGPSAFSEAETKANADFQTKIRPDIVITMHTGIAEFYWPWGWTHDPAPDDALFTSMEKPFEDATNGRVDAMQGAELYIVSGSSDDWAYGVLGAPGFTFEVHEDQFIPVYGQGIPSLIADQLAGLDWVVKNVRHIGAWVEVRREGAGWVATNEGWGVATNVTFRSGDQTAFVAEIAPGATVPVPLALAEGDTYDYPVLLIDTTKTRTHTVSVIDTAATDGGPAAVPGPGVALVALVALGALLLRRRR